MESKKNIPKGDFKIGQRVKTLREGQSLTQKELAVQIASPNGHLCHIRRPLCDLIGGQPGTH